MESPEKIARFGGLGETFGDALTYKLLTEDTKKIIYRSAVRPATVDGNRNLRLDLFGGEEFRKPVEVVRTHNTLDDLDKPGKIQGKSFDPDEILGLTFLKNPDDNGNRFRATIQRKINEIEDHTGELRTKYLVKVDGASQDEILTYNDIVELLQTQFEEDLDPD